MKEEKIVNKKKISIIKEVNNMNRDTFYWVEVDGKRVNDTITTNIDVINKFYQYIKNKEIQEIITKTELKTEFI